MLKANHVRPAFAEAREHGAAILAFSDHDYRDLRPDVELVRAMIATVRPAYPEVAVRFSGAEAAARDMMNVAAEPLPRLSLRLIDDRLVVQVEQGSIFGPQPFLALKTREGRVYHDNLDVQEHGRRWTYTLDDQTLPVSGLSVAGVATAGRFGGFDVARIRLD
jgi:hypothetical protein